MRRVIPRLFAACCTFALGISVAALRFEPRPPVSGNSLEPSTPGSQRRCDETLSLDPEADSAEASRLPILPYCELVNNQDCYKGRTVRVGARIFWIEHEMYFNDDGCLSKPGKQAEVQLHSAHAEEVYGVMMRSSGAHCYKPLDVVVIGRFADPASFEVQSFESVSRVR